MKGVVILAEKVSVIEQRLPANAALLLLSIHSVSTALWALYYVWTFHLSFCPFL
jgi:hypothetical protein